MGIKNDFLKKASLYFLLYIQIMVKFKKNHKGEVWGNKLLSVCKEIVCMVIVALFPAMVEL